MVRHSVEIVDTAGGPIGSIRRHVQPTQWKVNGRAQLPTIPLSR
jgi:hypothetical protein